MQTRYGTVGGVCAVGATLLLSGCTAEAAETPSAPPSSAAPAPSPTPDISASLAADEMLLPIPPGDVAAWSTRSLPEPGEDGTLATFYGWISRNNGGGTSVEYGPAPAGKYVVTVVCAGDSVTTVDMASSAGDPVGAVQCSDESVVLNVTTATPGLRAVLTLDDEGEPTNYALAYQTAPTG